MRKRMPKARPGELRAQWATTGDARGYNRGFETFGDLAFAWGAGCSRSDGHLLNDVLGGSRARYNFDRKPGDCPVVYDPSFLAELHRRGYDLTTLTFSVRKRDTGAHGRGDG